MKNKLLILLIAFMFGACKDVSSQTYVDDDRIYYYAGTYTYLHKEVTWSGSQTKRLQARVFWCLDPTWNQETKYDKYNVRWSKGAVFDWGNHYEGDKYVLHGTDPRVNSNGFPGGGGKGYFFMNPDAQSTISCIEITTQYGIAGKNSSNYNKMKCGDDELETNNTIQDNSQKLNNFYANCSNPIGSTYTVDIINDRVWVVNQAIYLNGQNLYHRLKENEWIKVDTNGIIVDRVVIDCEQGDKLVCIGNAEIPIDSDSMIEVASTLGFETDTTSTSLYLMGDRIGKYPPINFPNDFRGYKTNMYAYVNGLVSSVGNCNFTVPSSTQSQLLLWFESDDAIISNLNFCGGGANIYIEPMGGATRFVTIDFCDPPFSDKGEVRVSLRIDENPFSYNRQNRIVIDSDVFNMSLVVTQTSSVAPSPLVVDPTFMTFLAAGGTKTLNIESPSSWTATLSNTSSYHINKTSGTGNDNITVTAYSNPGNLILLGTITITNANETKEVSLTTGRNP